MSQIKLTETDLRRLEERLKEPSLPPEYNTLIKALLDVAKKHRIHGEGEVAWIYDWERRTPPKDVGSS
jgi:hypothetical protein